MTPIAPEVFPNPAHVTRLEGGSTDNRVPISAAHFSIVIQVPFLGWIAYVGPVLGLGGVPSPEDDVVTGSVFPEVKVLLCRSGFIKGSREGSSDKPVGLGAPLVTSGAFSVTVSSLFV